ncbi:LCP family protein [Flavonifractor plautii]|nr:LCP family protein [Flavonifractor plautii]
MVLYCAYRLASKSPPRPRSPHRRPPPPSPRIRPKRLAARGGRDIHFSAGRQRPVQRQRRHHHCGLLRHGGSEGGYGLRPRDTLLESGKINAAYHKGPENLRDTVSNLLGVPIDYYVAVDVDGFVALVDELGGIEFDVPVRMNFDDPTQDLHIHYQPGLQHLTGEDVLKVARCRNNSDGPGSYPDNLYGAYPDGDIGRTRTQQQLIAAILKKALSNPQKINSYVNLFLEYVDTDLEFSEALWFAQPALGLDFSTGFASATLAGENVYYVDSRGYRWGSCYELDPEAALETVNSLINPYNAPLTAADLNIFQKP